MPNKYYLREDRKAVNLGDKIGDFWCGGCTVCEACQHEIASLPALDVDPDYLKRLSTGWFEGEERWQVKRPVDKEWNYTSRQTFDGYPPERRRILIVASQEAENGQEGERDPFIEKHLKIIKEKMKDNFIHQHIGMMWGGLEMASIQHFVETGTINGSFRNNLIALIDAVMKWQINLKPATPQPVTGEALYRYLRINDILPVRDVEFRRRFCEAVDKYQAASRPSDAVEFAEWLGNNYNPYYDGEGSIYWSANLREKNYTTAELYQLFLNSKSPNPNK